MQKEKQFKNPPEVRAYLAKIKRDYRARHKGITVSEQKTEA
jgi:hypothetical protein